jgi:hypothetical protein
MKLGPYLTPYAIISFAVSRLKYTKQTLNKREYCNDKDIRSGCWWLMPVILAT